jgi:hypothetical protein
MATQETVGFAFMALVVVFLVLTGGLTGCPKCRRGWDVMGTKRCPTYGHHDADGFD